MDIQNTLKGLQHAATVNAPSLLASLGVGGVVSTAFLAGKASWRSANEIRDLEQKFDDPINGPITIPTKERVQLVWKNYIPAAAAGTATVAAIVLGHRIASSRQAALVAAYSVSETLFREYKEKVVEQIGENKEQKVRDAVAADHIAQTPPTAKDREVVFAGSKEVLIYESITGRYFHNTAENLSKAQNKINLEIINSMYVTLNQFFDEIGLSPTAMGEELGWNSATPLEIQFSSILDEEQVPCLHIGYRRLPVPNYADFH